MANQPHHVSQNKPVRAGVYLAREQNDKFWSLIVQISGHSPYLHYTSWNLVTKNMREGVDPSDFWFGPRIDAADEEVVPGADEMRS